jgi:two-component system chemotaxis sensor kinase CheA
MDDFELELKQGFLDEASQLLAEAEQCFLEIESRPDDAKLFEKIFRIAHNVKGSSRAVGFEDLGRFTHEFETFLLKVKNGELKATSPAVSLLLRCNDQVKRMVDGLKADPAAKFEFDALVAEIQAFGNEAGPEMPIVPAPPVLPASPEPPPVSTAPKAPPATDESIRVSLARLDKLIDFVGEMSILQTVLLEQIHGSNPRLLRSAAHQLGKVCKEVQDISMSLRMVPVKQTFQKMQRIVRDTAATLGKKVQLQLEGEETELDKTVLEAIGDPLVHLIRNAVDHGVEGPEQRSSAGKPDTGTILLRAGHLAGKLLIEVRDDGGGISGQRLLAKAIEKGVCRAGAQMSEAEAVQLIFHPGFSTKAQVTEVSGRGVGMDVVKTNIEQLQGTVEVQTEVGKGTTFRILLPLTLAIIDGMVVEAAGERFVIPLSHVHETVRPKAGELHQLATLGSALQLRGEVIPSFRLGQLLKRPATAKPSPAGADEIALIIRALGRPFAVLVDDIVRQQQVVIKQLGPELQGVKGYAGSANLGDGRPALILEVGELVNRPPAATKSKETA